ncbi:hypothetical protein SGLAD_v1c01500 [Spiroplasma gladiatoris]|uniref:Uncharacterized protein n=1 Tax=Spiroplasma gladiatoris TaxID=2143 RepID=A0A4V1AQ58_9MOLU|nr:hypothetical protein [Spiroplasma gladiatoris]QBQ07349.1 hypothetical protein SGLAD_v1c01500 [Spiroplasma gladiatoris]
MKKTQNLLSLGIYKMKLFMQQLVLTNGNEWLKDVLYGLLVNFAENVLEMIPNIKTMLSVPVAS